MRRLFERLAGDNLLRDLDAETFASKAASFMSDLNAIHPFREGNGRTQNSFLDLLAYRAGHPLDFDRLALLDLDIIRKLLQSSSVQRKRSIS
jgi:cell filamentation protein